MGTVLLRVQRVGRTDQPRERCPVTRPARAARPPTLLQRDIRVGFESWSHQPVLVRVPPLNRQSLPARSLLLDKAFVYEWRFFRHADVLQMAPDVVIGRRTVFGEQSGDGMRRLGHVETIVPAPDPLRCGNLSMLRTTTPRRAMMDA